MPGGLGSGPGRLPRVDRLLLSRPLVPGALDDFLRWCDELRARRDELERARTSAGSTRQVMWVHPESELVVVCLEGTEPTTALRSTWSSDEPFHRWHRLRELDVFGAPLLAEGQEPAEVLTEYRNGEPGPFDMFIAAGLPVLPGKEQLLRSAVEVSTGGGGGLQRVRRWGLKRLTVWLQHSADRDLVIYESVGDVPEMVRSLTLDEDPLIAEQRRIIDEVFGLDLASTSFPVPLPAFSWSFDADR